MFFPLTKFFRLMSGDRSARATQRIGYTHLLKSRTIRYVLSHLDYMELNSTCDLESNL